jgi:hypothetical protein
MMRVYLGTNYHHWAIAVEIDGSLPGRVHAYDLEVNAIPHPVGFTYEVQADQSWRTSFASPRCQHCLEIVGQYRRSDG